MPVMVRRMRGGHRFRWAGRSRSAVSSMFDRVDAEEGRLAGGEPSRSVAGEVPEPIPLLMAKRTARTSPGHGEPSCGGLASAGLG